MSRKGVSAVGASVACLLAALWTGAVAAQQPGQLAGAPTFLEDTMAEPCDVSGDLQLAPGGRAQIVFDYVDNQNYYLLDIVGLQATLYAVERGAPRALSAPAELTAGANGAFVVERRDWRIAFTVSGRTAARGYDSTFQQGQVGYVTSGGSAAADVWLQELGEIALEDDFVTEAGGAAGWTPLTGKWEVVSLRDDQQAGQMQADLSTNAFSYHAEAVDGPAVAVRNPKETWFHSNYLVEASVRSLATQAIGLVLYAQDAGNYLAFRWTSNWSQAPDRATAQIVEVVGGQPKVLAQCPGGFSPEQWYALRAAVCDGVIQCWVDDVPVLAARSELFGHGSAGLYAEGREGTFFDDILIRGFDGFRDGFDGEPYAWRQAGGQWEPTADGRLQVASGGEALIRTGPPTWRRYAYAADVKLAAGGAGLVLAADPQRGDVVVRLSATGSGKPYAGKLQIVRLDAPNPVLAEAAANIPAGGSCRLKATVDDGLVQAFVDDVLVAEAFDPKALAGGIGLYGDDAKGTTFDNAYVRLTAPKRTAHVAKEMADTSEHPEMREWASDRAAWVVPTSSARDSTYWTKGDYHGDVALTFPLRQIGTRDATARAVLGASPERPEAGVALEITVAQNTKTLRLSLSQGGQQLATTDYAAAGAEVQVRFERKGSFVVVYLADTPVLWYPS